MFATFYTILDTITKDDNLSMLLLLEKKIQWVLPNAPQKKLIC